MSTHPQGQSAEKDGPTWRDVAALYPSTVQQYVQRFGPLPEGPITPKAWDQFCAGEEVSDD